MSGSSERGHTNFGRIDILISLCIRIEILNLPGSGLGVSDLPVEGPG